MPKLKTKSGAKKSMLVGLSSEAGDQQTPPGTAFEHPRGGSKRVRTFQDWRRKLWFRLRVVQHNVMLVGLSSEVCDH